MIACQSCPWSSSSVHLSVNILRCLWNRSLIFTNSESWQESSETRSEHKSLPKTETLKLLYFYFSCMTLVSSYACYPSCPATPDFFWWTQHLFFKMCIFHITKTRLYNFDPLKSHFYIVKLGFTRVYIIFLILLTIHRVWVLVRTA